VQGILGWGSYLPYRRLDLSEVVEVAGGGGRRGRRAVASYDEDATTMGVEAARVALRSAPTTGVRSLWFSTVAPPYLDKTNTTAIHAALRLGRGCPAYDAGGAVRSTLGALRGALSQPSAALVVAADVRAGMAGGSDEAYFGDGAAAVLVGSADDGAVVAEVNAWSAVSDEFLDRWRAPGDVRSKVWEERFGERRYCELGIDAFEGVLKDAGLAPEQIDHLIVTGTHARACRSLVGRLGVEPERIVDDLGATVGNTGASHPLLLLGATLEVARANEVIVMLVLADGAEAIVIRTQDAIKDHVVTRNVADQVSAGGPLPYGKYLAWRGLLAVEPPRRPEPSRVSASAAGRSVPWKFGFVGSRADDGAVHLPPEAGELEHRPMAEVQGTVTTFTIDKLSYSPSPPTVFAVVDFDGGGRLPIELTDVDATSVKVGDRVEMTFRRLSTSDGIHNYFWKARPIRGGNI
jgi:hydroxymethylglutaryl-CoA synthase